MPKGEHKNLNEGINTQFKAQIFEAVCKYSAKGANVYARAQKLRWGCKSTVHGANDQQALESVQVVSTNSVIEL